MPGMCPALAPAVKRRVKSFQPLMKQVLLGVLGAALAFVAAVGCSSKKESPAPTAAQPAATPDATAAPAPSSTTEVISAARNSIKAGNVDEAAARLAQLQAQGASFNANQAKDYRQALREAYDRAYEGAQRGDPRAQAALQLLRAAGPR